MATSSSFALPDSRVISYTLSANPATGPVVLLSNSLCADKTSWDHVAAKLAANGFRTLQYDQPGHGGSSVPDDLSSTTFEVLADDIYALLKHTALLDAGPSISACGVSMGAATLAYFVTRYPRVFEKVVICDTISSSPVNAGSPDLFGQRVAAARQAGDMVEIREQTLVRWFGDKWIAANPEEATRMRSLMATTTVDGFETCCAALRSSTFDLAPLLPKVADGCKDVLLIVGEKDADLPVKMEKMRCDIEEGFQKAGTHKSVALKVIDSAGHVCYIDGHELFMDALLQFLTQDTRA